MTTGGGGLTNFMSPFPEGFTATASERPPLFELPEGKVGAVEQFLQQAAKSATQGKGVLDQIAGTQVPGARPDVAIPAAPSVDFAKLDLLGALHGAHADPVDAPRFESLLSQAARPHGADHVTQQAMPRFGNLVMAQLKNATFHENRTRIELAPRGLGDIQISVETDPSGRVTAMVRAENPQVLDLLRTDRAQLEAMLAEKGFDMSNGDLDFEGFSGHEGQRAEDDSSGAALNGAAEDEMATDDPDLGIGGGHLNILA